LSHSSGFLRYMESDQKNTSNTMNIQDLQQKLLEAYSNQNLTRITITLINLFKEKQFGKLSRLVEMLSETIEIKIDPDARYFSKLMMLYHPDRGNFHRLEIERLTEGNNYDGLLSYTHIFLLNNIEEIAASLSSIEDIDYSPVYEWDFTKDGFTITDSHNRTEEKTQGMRANKKGVSFYNALKIRMYGTIKIEFPPYYLEDIEEFELSQSGIDDLDGIQYCIHAINVDLSCNLIEDISGLWGLSRLEELNLTDNKISDIDTLSNLKRLKTLYLSDNRISDISPLFDLGQLEYVEILGLKVPHEQIEGLRGQGVVIIT
jgi:Leucine-rich repeat (LRR) protein